MSQWSYVAAAYAVTLAATLGLLARSALAMRRAELAVDALRQRSA